MRVAGCPRSIPVELLDPNEDTCVDGGQRSSDGRRRKLNFAWCTIRAKKDLLGLDELVPGSSIAMIVDGETLVGELRHVGGRWITWRPWGRRVEQVPRESITGARLLGPHCWGEAQVVRRRQAAHA